MKQISEILDELAADRFNRFWQAPAWKQFITTGEPKHLAALPKAGRFEHLSRELLEALGLPRTLDEAGQRLLRACGAAQFHRAAGQWLAKVAAEDPEGGQFAEGCRLLLALGWPGEILAWQIAGWISPLRRPDGTPSAAGNHLLGLADAELGRLFTRLVKENANVSETGVLLAVSAPARLARILTGLLRSGKPHSFRAGFWVALLNVDTGIFGALAEEALDLLTNQSERFLLAERLELANPSRHGPLMERLARQMLRERDSNAEIELWTGARDAAIWLATRRGGEAGSALQLYFAAPLSPDAWRRKNQSVYKIEALDAAARVLGRGVVPLLEACFETAQPEVQLRALQLWTGFQEAGDTGAIAARFEAAFGGADFGAVARLARLAGDWNAAAVEAALWPLLGHKSRPVREAAAAALARLGDARLPRAAELWAARKADTRLAAASWLRALGTPAAAAELRARLEVEEDENVRDGLLQALEHLAGGSPDLAGRDLRARIQKTLARVKSPPAPWLDPERLPKPTLQNGQPLDAEALRYLLYRQSRVKEIRADLEARPLYALIDRATSGGLALAVLEGFLGSEMEADDRWAMAFAALTGDDRLVPVLSRQIREWAEAMRGKLAEYAVQALALLGTDAALLAVDALAIRYRSKNKNIGKAASEAFAGAAHARNLTPEELGDLVVPWLGFRAGEPRIVETGKGRVEIRIGADFKLAFRDADTRKRVAKLPTGVPAELKAEMQALTAGLKEAVKSQLLRMENLMVRQFRWSAARWRELYLAHPLLRPFGQRLAWGGYDAAGRLAAVFRALEDGSLTNELDEPPNLEAISQVGIVHPLELAPAAREAWVRHLADYEIEPPFAQLDRPLATVLPEQRETRFGQEFSGTSLNAMTFKGRAERLGWSRGSVCDAGGIGAYLKSFPAAGVDVFLQLEGMYVGIDMYTDITLGKVYFVKHGSVQIGSYLYNEPDNANDPRLVPYGQAPAIAFSEAMGDLVRIAGKAQAGEPDHEA